MTTLKDDLVKVFAAITTAQEEMTSLLTIGLVRFPDTAEGFRTVLDLAEVEVETAISQCENVARAVASRVLRYAQEAK